MADIQITGTTKLGGSYAKSAQVYANRPGESGIYLGTSNTNGNFTFYLDTSGAGTYQVYTRNENGLVGPTYSLNFDAGPFEWNVGNITIYGFRLTGTTKYNGVQGAGNPVLFKPPGGSYSSLGPSNLDGSFTFYIEPSQTGTCELKSKNPFDEESSVYTYSFTTSSSDWNVGTVNIPILRIYVSGNVYVSKDYGSQWSDTDIQISISDTCTSSQGTTDADFRNTGELGGSIESVQDYPTYRKIPFPGGSLYLPTWRKETTLYIYSRDHQCPPGGVLPVSNIESTIASTNEHSFSGLVFKHPPGLLI